MPAALTEDGARRGGAAAGEFAVSGPDDVGPSQVTVDEDEDADPAAILIALLDDGALALAGAAVDVVGLVAPLAVAAVIC